jgi:hypothetical protein
MATATKAPASLADYFAERAPDPSPEYITTLGKNRQSGYIRERDPYYVGNMAAGFVSCAFSERDGQLTQACARGWIPFEPDRVSRNKDDTSKVYIANYNVDNGFVVVGFGHNAMVMCWANKKVIEANRKVANDRWNTRFHAQLTGNEKPGVLPKEDSGYTGGYTTDLGNQAAVGYEESTASIDPNNLTSDLFPSSERE